MVTEELNVVTDAFVRINSQGKTMGEAHMLRALTHLGTVDTDTHFGLVKRHLEPLGWGSLDDQVLVNALKAQLGLDIYTSDVRGVHDALTGDPALLTRLSSVLEEAVAFLAEVGVRGPSALPYTYQLVTLAALAAKQPGVVHDPRNAATLRHWFWTTTYTEFYSGITGARIRDAITELELDVNRARPPRLNELVPVKPLRTVRGATGRTRAFLLFLSQLPTAPEAQQRRQETLTGRIEDAVPSLLPSAPASLPGNRVIASPSDLRAIRVALKAKRVSNELVDEFGIPREALVRLPNDPDGFVAARSAWLVKKEKAFIESFGMTVGETD